MNERTFLDRLHARAQGRLAPDERAELERELAADPERAALAEDYRLVHALTAHDAAPGPGSRTSFEALEPRLAERRAWRPAAAAAAVLLAGGAYLAGRLARANEPLYLQAIELDPPRVRMDLAPDLPREWGRYDPRGELGVSFLTDVTDAEELARATHRPLLVYGTYPGCPMAAALDAHVFKDARVVALAERTVPVHIDLTQLPVAEERALTARGYPFLEMWDVEGKPTHSLARNPDAATFVESLHDGLEKSDAIGEQPPWEEIHRAVGPYLAARGDELAGRLVAAEHGYRALVEDEHTPSPLAERAAAGLRRLSDSARDALFEACAAAGDDPAGARRVLTDALARFAGTRFEVDLRGALERLEHDGRFPALAVARRPA